MIRVYEYGCLRPIAGEAEAMEQMRRRNRLWNALVEVETTHRQKAAELLSEPEEQAPVTQALETLQDLRTAIKQKRQAARSTKVDVSELKTEIAATKVQLNGSIAIAKAKRKERVAERKSQLTELNQQRVTAMKQATHAAELYWCNYDDVLASYDTARQRSRTGLRFHAFRGEGKVSIRYQTGLPVEKVFGEDTRLQLRALSEEEIRATGRKNPKARHEVALRVGSLRRAPIWFRLPVVLHRPLPEDGIVRAAAIKREVVAGRPRYKLLITVNDLVDVEPKAGERVCAIDVGWRLVPSDEKKPELRVAYWADAEGQHGSLRLSHSVLWEFERVRTLQSTIDKKFEEIKAYLIDRVGHEELAVPTEELRQELATIAQWRSPGRLYGWARKAKEAGLADVELENWRRKQMHLYQWAANLQDQVVKRRRYIYRNFAAQIAGHYDRIILEEFDLRRVAEHAQPEAKEEAVETRAARYRQIASISELRTTLENTAAREGTQIEKREARLTTQRCHVCGNTARWDAAESVIHRCDLCQSVWDQDYNAAQNLLREFADRPVLEAKA